MSSRRHNRNPESTVLHSPLPLWQAGLALALLSAASMAFEVVLTHLFSEVFQYHFAFLAVSTAILGLGIGAAISFRLPASAEHEQRALMSTTAAVLAVVLPLALILFIATGFVPGYVLQILLGMLPFLVTGLLTSRLYAFYAEKAAWLYAFDLGGAALGLFGVLTLLDAISAISTGLALGLLAAAAALLFAENSRSGRLLPVGALLLTLALLGINLGTHVVDLPHVSANNTPADKTMYQVLANDSSARIVDSTYSSYARVDLVSTRDSSQMYAFTNAGAGSYMLAYNGDLSKVNWLKSQVEYVPFLDETPNSTLILGAGAGKDVLQALLAGNSSITAVEINPAMVEMVRRHADFDGNILDAAGVTTVVADGRDFVTRSSDAYDMIYLNLVYSQAPAPGSNALSEAYIFTTEAFEQYWQHLAADGRLAIVAHQGLEGARAMITAIQALQNLGIAPTESLKHMALLMYDSSDVNQSTTVFVLQKSALSAAQIQTLNNGASATGMSPLYLPGVYEKLFDGLNTGKISLSEYLVQNDYNLFPTSDDQPFFFNVNPGLPDALKTLLAIAAAALVLYLLSLLGSPHRPRFNQFVFFGALGVGYFFVEMPFIQRSQLLTGNPTLAMVAVLAALLLGGGLGSFLSSRWSMEGLWQKIALAALLNAVLVVALAFFQPQLNTLFESMSFTPRLILAGLVLLPGGILMGVPFANGLRLASRADNALLPYLWGWNSVTSVAGSAAAAALAMLIGFRANLLIGAGCYALAALSAWAAGRKG